MTSQNLPLGYGIHGLFDDSKAGRNVTFGIEIPTVSPQKVFIFAFEKGPIYLRTSSYSANPTGRLPLTIPNTENELGFTEEQFPGTKDEFSTLASFLRVFCRPKVTLLPALESSNSP